ncbi:MAG: hypothetical protein RL686_1190, partial [Pseudomonadota bacterium]
NAHIAKEAATIERTANFIFSSNGYEKINSVSLTVLEVF